jgi:hypothetical protein
MSQTTQPSGEESAELRELIDALCADTMSCEQRDRLDTLLRDNPQNQSFYLSYLNVHAQLHWELRSGLPDPAAPEDLAVDVARDDDRSRNREMSDLEGTRSPRSLTTSATNDHRSRRSLAAAVLVMIAAGTVTALVWKPWDNGRGGLAAQPHVATLIDGAAAEWSDGGPAPNVGDWLPEGELHLLKGFAELELAGGAVVLLEGPARLELLGPDRAFLHAGRLVARASGESAGFIVETDRASVLDVGTEFGVEVSPSGTTVVQVFDGSVVARYHSGDSDSAASRELTAGRACEIANGNGSRPRELDFVPQRFVRRLPKPDERGGAPNRPYNQPRFDTVHIVPAPPNVTIDGDLSDWDTSGMFRSACDDPYGGNYYVEASMMYDRRQVYIGAHVGDPAPLCNVIDPQLEPGKGWRGGGVQIRLSTDRNLKWPLSAVSRDGAVLEKRPLGPEDANDRLVHLTMWRFEPEQRPCLFIEYGMDSEPTAVNPSGYRGAFRRDEDGRGYTLEYAIDWELLAAGDDPPQAGDELAAAWTVHWSDPGGQSWRGHLVDVIDAEETAADKGMGRWTFVRAATWGKAIYHSTGNLPAETIREIEGE